MATVRWLWIWAETIVRVATMVWVSVKFTIQTNIWWLCRSRGALLTAVATVPCKYFRIVASKYKRGRYHSLRQNGLRHGMKDAANQMYEHTSLHHHCVLHKLYFIYIHVSTCPNFSSSELHRSQRSTAVTPTVTLATIVGGGERLFKGMPTRLASYSCHRHR